MLLSVCRLIRRSGHGQSHYPIVTNKSTTFCIGRTPSRRQRLRFGCRNPICSIVGSCFQILTLLPIANRPLHSNFQSHLGATSMPHASPAVEAPLDCSFGAGGRGSRQIAGCLLRTEETRSRQSVTRVQSVLRVEGVPAQGRHATRGRRETLVLVTHAAVVVQMSWMKAANPDRMCV